MLDRHYVLLGQMVSGLSPCLHKANGKNLSHDTKNMFIVRGVIHMIQNVPRACY
jgi:hypothetical protein